MKDNPIEQAIEHLEGASIYSDLGTVHSAIDKALTALREAKEVDVEGLKTQTVEAIKSDNGFPCEATEALCSAYVYAAINYLAAQGIINTPDTIAKRDVLDIIKRLRNTPNWKREEFGDWKESYSVYDRTPFEAADILEALADEGE